MKINEVIRKYRKEQNLTQEQVANHLGVTAPAVNKWENGISYPDITLLAPLARILNINIDTLLSFKDDLTDIEINQFIKDISGEISSLGYIKTFNKVSNKVKEYPNCYKLILYVAQIMNAYLAMGVETVSEQEKYQKQITAWFEIVTFSNNKELANMAIISLSQEYMNKGEYEKAQKLLDKIPPSGFDKRTTQATLFIKRGEYEEAYEIYEKMLYQYINNVINILMQLISLLCEEKNYEKALKYSELVDKVANNFDLGKYIGASSKLPIYLVLKDKNKSIETLEEIIKGIDSLTCARNSKLYQHMRFKEEDGIEEMEKMIKDSLKVDKELDFLRDNPRFKFLMDKLK